MKKKVNVSALLLFIASFLSYITAIIWFVSESGMAVVYLCLGSAFLCLGGVRLKKDKDSDKKE